MKIYKAITFAYANSPNAEILGFAKIGCFHIEVTYINIEDSGQCKTFMPHNAEGFENQFNLDLLSQFEETEGEKHEHQI